jgi:hypothetical protein
MATKQKLTIGEKIDRARELEGRTQTWVIAKLNENGCKLNDVTFSRKKKGHVNFTQYELETLSTILSFDL